MQQIDAPRNSDINLPVKKFDFADVWQEYYDAAMAVSVGDMQLRRALLSDALAAQREDCITVKLSYTCKTHKPDGEVVLRPIHAYTSSPMAPGMRWLASSLDSKLRKLPHLLKDADDLQRRLKHFKIPHGCRFLKLDVKDFYLTGNHGEIVSKSASIFDASERANYQVMADAILHNQYIRSPLLPGLWKVNRGTGMGMIPSGSISDATLFSCLERDYILKPSVRSEFQILFYARFRDDILIFVNSDLDRIRVLLDEIRSHAKPFNVTLDAISKRGFQMLDLDVRLTPCFDHFLCSFRLFVKPTSIWKPLSPESLHPSSIHKHWPRAQCERIRKRFSCKAEGETAVAKLKALYFDSFGITVADKQKPHLPKSPISSSSWMVMPYHLCLVMSHFGQVVSSLVVPQCLSFDRVRLSWKLNSPHLIHRLRRKTFDVSKMD